MVSVFHGMCALIYIRKRLSCQFFDKSYLSIAISEIKIQSGLLDRLLSALPTNQINISKAQEGLILWHIIFGHYDIIDTQGLMTFKGKDDEARIIPRIS